MSHCVFDPKKSIHDIFTNLDTYKHITFDLCLVTGVNILAAKVLSGSIKQAAFFGLSSALGFNVAHFAFHRLYDEGVQIAMLLSLPLSSIACSYFSNMPIVTIKTLGYTVSPIATFIVAGKVDEYFSN